MAIFLFRENHNSLRVIVLGAKSVEGVGEAVNSDANSDPKQLARQLLSEGLDVDSVVAQSGRVITYFLT